MLFCDFVENKHRTDKRKEHQQLRSLPPATYDGDRSLAYQIQCLFPVSNGDCLY
jgi:hypothetical protein